MDSSEHSVTQAVLQGGEEECGCLFLDLKNAYPSVRFTWMVDQLEKWWRQTGTAMGRILLGGWAKTEIEWLVKAFSWRKESSKEI